MEMFYILQDVNTQEQIKKKEQAMKAAVNNAHLLRQLKHLRNVGNWFDEKC